VSCCGPFFIEPADFASFAVDGQIGKQDELIILVSAPGDFHPWHGTHLSPGNVHTTFENYAKASEGRVRFCPIQVRGAYHPNPATQVITWILCVNHALFLVTDRKESPLSLVNS